MRRKCQWLLIIAEVSWGYILMATFVIACKVLLVFWLRLFKPMWLLSVWRTTLQLYQKGERKAWLIVTKCGMWGCAVLQSLCFNTAVLITAAHSHPPPFSDATDTADMGLLTYCMPAVDYYHPPHHPLLLSSLTNTTSSEWDPPQDTPHWRWIPKILVISPVQRVISIIFKW